MYTSAALFDLDHTLFKVNSSYCFGTYLNKRGVISNAQILYLIGSYCLHKLNLLSFFTLHRRSFRTLAGMPVADLTAHLSEWLEQEWDNVINVSILNELQDAQNQNAFTAILSNSSNFLVEPIARKLNVNDWLATRYIADSNSRLSAIESLVEGQDKADYIDRLIKEKQIPRESITAYSDSHHDLPFLERAGRPIAVNPDRCLKAHCLRNNWQVRS